MTRAFRPWGRRLMDISVGEMDAMSLRRNGRLLDREQARVDAQDDAWCPSCGDRRGLLHDEWQCLECDDFDASGEDRAA